MRTFLLVGQSRKTGKDELILGREASGSDHVKQYRELAGKSVNEDYKNVALIESRPFKRPLKFLTESEADARKNAANEASKLSAETKAQAPADTAKPHKKHKK